MENNTSLLEQINEPSDLKGLTLDQLEALAREIRDFMVTKVSKTGGHLGAPLGTVELTLGLHRVYDSPKDKIVLDTGHQGYTHKIVTGRRDEFHTLRTYKGIAGFLKRSESVHDAFGAGHASTSISAALGFALARDVQGTDEKVVAVIGDGALTGGLAYEALNNAGDIDTDLLVVLNDNVMSINENVGAISNYLNRLMTAPLYHRVKDDAEDLLSQLTERTLLDKRFPGILKIGNTVLDKAHRLKEGLKNMVVPSVLFEELGFTYYGPIPGHDIHSLVPMLEKVKNIHGPVLLHVITHKGKGYEWSETHPEKYHGAKAGFDPESGKLLKKSSGPSIPSWTEVFASELVEIARENSKVCAITAAMPSGTGLLDFKEQFPNRFFDVGIAEGHAVVSAAGMAAGGLRPVVAVYSTFLQRAYDMMIHDVGIQNLPVLFAMDRAGLVGADGETHQGLYDIGFCRQIPNFTVMAPKDDEELRAMMRLGLSIPGPSTVRYNRGSAPVAGKLSTPIEMGKAEVLKEGSDLVFIGVGSYALEALEVANEIEKENDVSIAVVNLRFIKPVDSELIERLGREIGKIITFEEGMLAGGAGSLVLEVLADAGIKANVKRIGVDDEFVEHGNPDEVRPDLRMAPADLKKAALTMLSESQAEPVAS